MRARSTRQRLGSVGAVAALAAISLVFAACTEVPSNVVSNQPYSLEPIEGSDIQLVKMRDETAAKIGVQTAEASGDAEGIVVPHVALIFSPEGEPFLYTKPAPESYLREPIEISRVEGDRLVLSKGPLPGTTVVTVGAAELLATEFEILNQHP